MTPPELTPELFCRAGAALYGSEWQMPTARLLDVDPRRIRRIAQAAREGRPYDINQNWRAELAAAVRRAATDHELRGREAEAVARLLEGRDD